MKDAIYWLALEEGQLPHGIDWLTPRERKIVERFSFPKKRRDWLLGRWTAKQAVLLHCQKFSKNLSVDTIEIIAASDGAPEVFVKDFSCKINLSLSHSSGIALCALAPQPMGIGCDLEKLEERSEYFIRDYFTARERQLIKANPNQSLLANLLWSSKESILKILRQGLRYDTRRAEITETGDADFSMMSEWQELQFQFDHASSYTVYFKQLEGHIMTIAVASDVPAIISLDSAEPFRTLSSDKLK